MPATSLHDCCIAAIHRHIYHPSVWNHLGDMPDDAAQCLLAAMTSCSRQHPRQSRSGVSHFYSSRINPGRPSSTSTAAASELLPLDIVFQFARSFTTFATSIRTAALPLALLPTFCSNFPFLVELGLEDCPPGDSSAAIIASSLPCLTRLALTGCRVTTTGVKILARPLKHRLRQSLARLQELDLSSNALDTHCFADLLSFPSLRKVYLSGNAFTLADAQKRLQSTPGLALCIDHTPEDCDSGFRMRIDSAGWGIGQVLGRVVAGVEHSSTPRTHSGAVVILERKNTFQSPAQPKARRTLNMNVADLEGLFRPRPQPSHQS